jgi:hypothetical protein
MVSSLVRTGRINRNPTTSIFFSTVLGYGEMEQESSMQDYHQLDIWNRAMDYAVVIYQLAATLPEEEKYNLASQLRRAVT